MGSSMQSERQPHGRYDPTRRAIWPANGIATPPITRNVQTVLGVVTDPMDAVGELYVSINRKVDILEQERSHKRISEAGYRIGRQLQATFEAGSRMGSGAMWREGDRVDAAQAKEAAIVRNVEVAQRIDAEMARLASEVGAHGAAFLRAILTGRTFAELAGNGASRAEIAVVAGRFRAMLKEIEAGREARGPAGSRVRAWADQDERSTTRAQRT